MMQNSTFDPNNEFNRLRERNTLAVEHDQLHSKKVKVTASYAEFVGVACGAAIRTLLNHE